VGRTGKARQVAEPLTARVDLLNRLSIALRHFNASGFSGIVGRFLSDVNDFVLPSTACPARLTEPFETAN